MSTPAPHIDIEVDLRRALIGGVLAGMATLAGGYAVGRASGYEALALLESTLPVTRTVASTVMLASSTILALMLTLLSVSASTQISLKDTHYKRVRQVSFIDVIALILSTLVLLLLNVPLQESENLPASWFNTVYYLSLGSSSVLGGFLITIILMIYNTVRDIIEVVGLSSPDHPLVEEEEAEQRQEKREEQQEEQ